MVAAGTILDAVTGEEGPTGATTTLADGIGVGAAVEDWTGDARFYEYSQAADPMEVGAISPVPLHRFAAGLHSGGPTRVIPLDLSDELGTEVPATGPSVLASFVRIEAGHEVAVGGRATSVLAYVLSGRGRTECGSPSGAAMGWEAGDVITLPGGELRHLADEDAVLYQVDDSPLLAYLGVAGTVPRFAPTRFDGATARARLAEVAAAPAATDRSRVAVLLGNARNDRTLTATHTLWAMLGVLPTGAVQLPHRHQSIALDLIIDCRPGCFTLLGESVGPDGRIVAPTRVDWEAGGAFVTPPGLWHSHHNESGAPAHLLPVQDAGLHTYLRTLDIRFTRR